MFELDEDQRDARGKLRIHFQTSFAGEESKTVQSDAQLASIQEILKAAGGLPQMLDTVDAQFMDVSEFTDYSDMMREVRGAELAFMQLDPKVRALFNHDVYEWLDRAHEERRAAAPREERERDGDEPPVEVEVPPPAVEPVADRRGATGS